jgi:hypothetical protein
MDITELVKKVTCPVTQFRKFILNLFTDSLNRIL